MRYEWPCSPSCGQAHADQPLVPTARNPLRPVHLQGTTDGIYSALLAPDIDLRMRQYSMELSWLPGARCKCTHSSDNLTRQLMVSTRLRGPATSKPHLLHE